MLGINTRVHLAEAEGVLRQRINRRWMGAGVTLLDPATTYIDADGRDDRPGHGDPAEYASCSGKTVDRLGVPDRPQQRDRR